MFKTTAASILLASFILLSACAVEGIQSNESNIGVNSSGNDLKQMESDYKKSEQKEPEEQANPKAKQEDISNFQSGMFIDLKAYEDQLMDEKASVLTALENNLVSLVDHSNTDYKSGFVSEKLADAMKYYYGDQFQYRFTEIESIEPNPKNDHLHITVLGQRLDTSLQTIEDIKMMYALGQNNQGDWVIYTID
ncbi:hypothetical protein [Paenibacillus luteus]|uniref:hypothetical protein n=1 Tax=Paenibacillus luteus TaxID=2545753 RepID=UPI0011440BF9|nr:hypothetical protein [Paenibacillus luteus]